MLEGLEIIPKKKKMPGTSLPLLLAITVSESKQMLKNTCLKQRLGEPYINVKSDRYEDSLISAFQILCIYKCQFVVIGKYKYKSYLLVMCLMRTIKATQHRKN